MLSPSEPDLTRSVLLKEVEEWRIMEIVYRRTANTAMHREAGKALISARLALKHYDEAHHVVPKHIPTHLTTGQRTA